MQTGVNHEPHLALVAAHGESIGGMEKSCRFIVETAISHDWRVTVALSGQDVYGGLAPPGRRLAVDHVDWVDANLAGDRTCRMRVVLSRRRWFRRNRPSVVLFVQSSNTPFRAAVAGARLAGVPIVITHRTMPWIRDFVPSRRHVLGLLPGLGLHNRRQILHTWLTAVLAERIVYNSECTRRCYERDYHYPAGKGAVIANHLTPPDGPAGHAEPAETITIGYAGRLAAEKQLDVLLRAVAALPTPRPVRVLVYGEGPEREPLARLANELGLGRRVEWRGHSDDVWSAYARMDIVALCSRRESSSNMVLEAMGAGKAVVVSDVGGLPELVKRGECGVIVPAGDVSALARALQELVEHDDRRTAMGEQARRVAVEKHDPQRIGGAWMGLLRCIAKPGMRRLVESSNPAEPVPANSVCP